MAFLTKTADSIEKNWFVLLDIFAPIFFALYILGAGFWLPYRAKNVPAENFGDSIKYWLSDYFIWIGIVIILANILGSWFTKKEIGRLRSENQDLESKFNASRKKNENTQQDHSILRENFENFVYEATSSFLQQLGLELNFSDKERISLYLCVGNDFVLCGRYSEHPDHNKRNRVRFPRKQGCIGKAWTDGFHHIILPHPNQDKKSRNEQLCKDYSFSKQDLSALRMQSCHYIGQAILSFDGHRKGVIIVESEDPNKYDKEGKDIQICVDKHCRYLAGLLNHSQSISNFAFQNKGLK